MKIRYCEKCGSKMRLIQREGHIRSISFDGEKYYYGKKYNYKTGKLFKLYECPDFAIVSGRWFSHDKLNSHDFFTE